MNRRWKNSISLIYIYCILRYCSRELLGHRMFSALQRRNKLHKTLANCPLGVHCMDLRYCFLLVLLEFLVDFLFLIMLSRLLLFLVLSCFSVWCKHHDNVLFFISRSLTYCFSSIEKGPSKQAQCNQKHPAYLSVLSRVKCRCRATKALLVLLRKRNREVEPTEEWKRNAPFVSRKA